MASQDNNSQPLWPDELIAVWSKKKKPLNSLKENLIEIFSLWFYSKQRFFWPQGYKKALINNNYDQTINKLRKVNIPRNI